MLESAIVNEPASKLSPLPLSGSGLGLAMVRDNERRAEFKSCLKGQCEAWHHECIHAHGGLGLLCSYNAATHAPMQTACASMSVTTKGYTAQRHGLAASV